MPLRKEPQTVNVTLTSQGTEYPFVLPRAAVAFDIQARQARAVLMSFQENGTDIPAGGTPWTIKSGDAYYKDVDQEHGIVTIYFRDTANAGTVVELILWREVGL